MGRREKDSIILSRMSLFCLDTYTHLTHPSTPGAVDYGCLCILTACHPISLKCVQDLVKFWLSWFARDMDVWICCCVDGRQINMFSNPLIRPSSWILKLFFSIDANWYRAIILCRVMFVLHTPTQPNILISTNPNPLKTSPNLHLKCCLWSNWSLVSSSPTLYCHTHHQLATVKWVSDYSSGGWWESE